MSDAGIVMRFVPSQHSHLVAYLAAIHAGCITHDRTIATFLPPLSHEKLLAWWKDRISEVNDETRVIHILVKKLGPDGRLEGPDVMGVVMLSIPFSETGRSRGSVEKLLVHKGHRGKGAARALLMALEADAIRRGRKLLTLDTETGSIAELVYRKLGYVEVGKVPKYGINPEGDMKGGTFFYKQL